MHGWMGGWVDGWMTLLTRQAAVRCSEACQARSKSGPDRSALHEFRRLRNATASQPLSWEHRRHLCFLHVRCCDSSCQTGALGCLEGLTPASAAFFLSREVGCKLETAYRQLLQMLALPLAPNGSEGLIEKQIYEICIRPEAGLRPRTSNLAPRTPNRFRFRFALGRLSKEKVRHILMELSFRHSDIRGYMGNQVGIQRQSH